MKLGFELFVRAALLGDGEAMANLGHCYESGSGCASSTKDAIMWYKKSLERIPNQDLEETVEFLEMIPDMDEEKEEEHSGDQLTAEEQSFIDRVDASLPDNIRTKLQTLIL